MNNWLFLNLITLIMGSPFVAYYVYLYKRYSIEIFDKTDAPYKKYVTDDKEKGSYVKHKVILKRMKERSVFFYYFHYFYMFLIFVFIGAQAYLE